MKILIFNFSNGFTGFMGFTGYGLFIVGGVLFWGRPGYLDRASCFLSDSWVGSCLFFFSFVDVGLGDGGVFLYIQFLTFTQNLYPNDYRQTRPDQTLFRVSYILPT